MVSKVSRKVSNTRSGFILYVTAISNLNCFIVLSDNLSRRFKRIFAIFFDLIIFKYVEF